MKSNLNDFWIKIFFPGFATTCLEPKWSLLKKPNLARHTATNYRRELKSSMWLYVSLIFWFIWNTILINTTFLENKTLRSCRAAKGCTRSPQKDDGLCKPLHVSQPFAKLGGALDRVTMSSAVQMSLTENKRPTSPSLLTVVGRECSFCPIVFLIEQRKWMCAFWTNFSFISIVNCMTWDCVFWSTAAPYGDLRVPALSIRIEICSWINSELTITLKRKRAPLIFRELWSSLILQKERITETSFVTSLIKYAVSSHSVNAFEVAPA